MKVDNANKVDNERCLTFWCGVSLRSVFPDMSLLLVKLFVPRTITSHAWANFTCFRVFSALLRTMQLTKHLRCTSREFPTRTYPEASASNTKS